LNFEDEHYVRVYTRDTKTWLRWGWEGQTVFMFVMRKLDKSGVLDDIEEPVADVALMTGLPREVVAVGLPRILESGALEQHGKALVAPKYIDAQSAKRSDKQRAKESRERRRNTAQSGPVTKRDGSSRDDAPESKRGSQSREGGTPESSAETASVTNRDAHITERDDSITIRDDSSQCVTDRHSTQYNATQRNADAPSPPAAAAAPDRAPQSRDEAMRLPVDVRARWATERRDTADWTCAHQWPEVVTAAEIIRVALELGPLRLSPASKDSGVRAILVLLAAGYTEADFKAAAKAIPTDKWMQDKRAIGALSPEVMRNLLNGKGSRPKAASMQLEDLQ
jgi:hypothetical protein